MSLKGTRASACGMLDHSDFSSDRINLSPFTKDFRGEDHKEFYLIFYSPAEVGLHYMSKNK